MPDLRTELITKVFLNIPTREFQNATTAILWALRDGDRMTASQLQKEMPPHLGKITPTLSALRLSGVLKGTPVEPKTGGASFVYEIGDLSKLKTGWNRPYNPTRSLVNRRPRKQPPRKWSVRLDRPDLQPSLDLTVAAPEPAPQPEKDLEPMIINTAKPNPGGRLPSIQYALVDLLIDAGDAGLSVPEIDARKPNYIHTFGPMLSKLFYAGALDRWHEVINGGTVLKYKLVDENKLPECSPYFKVQPRHARASRQRLPPEVRQPDLPLPPPAPAIVYPVDPAPLELAPAKPEYAGPKILIAYGGKQRAIPLAEARELFDQLKIVFGG